MPKQIAVLTVALPEPRVTPGLRGHRARKVTLDQKVRPDRRATRALKDPLVPWEQSRQTKRTSSEHRETPNRTHVLAS
jgi:hypothetical protein